MTDHIQTHDSTLQVVYQNVFFVSFCLFLSLVQYYWYIFSLILYNFSLTPSIFLPLHTHPPLAFSQFFQESDRPACHLSHFFLCSQNPKIVLTASLLSSLSLHFPFNFQMLNCISGLFSVLFHPLTFYFSYCPVSQSLPSTLCRLCIVARDESQNTPLICFSECDPNCFGQAWHACARGPFVGQ